MSRLRMSPDLQMFVDQERRRRQGMPGEPDQTQPGDFSRQAQYAGPAMPDYPMISPQPDQERVMMTPHSPEPMVMQNPAAGPMAPPPSPEPTPEDERADMIRGQLQAKLGAQMGAAGPLGAMGGFLNRGASAPAATPPMSPPGGGSPLLGQPPANGQLGGLGDNPFMSSIVTGSGTRTMAFPQGPGGTYGRGQDLGMQPWEQQGNPADALRSSFQRNLYGTGAPSSFLPAPLAAEMAMQEMRNRTLQQEGGLQRQNLLEREALEQKGRVEAANLSHRFGQNTAQYQGAVNAFLGGQGPQFAQADAFARSLGGGMGGGGGPAVAGGPVPSIPALPSGMAPPADPDVMARVNRLMLQESPTLPNSFSYEIPGMGMGANKKPAMAIKGGIEGKVTPEIANKLLGRFSAEKFGDAEFGALADVLGRSSGGQEIRKALLGQMATDELAFRPPPVQGQSGLGSFFPPALVGRTNVYPSQMGYSDVMPGATLQADQAETWLGQGLKSLRDRMYSGGLPYRSLNVGGERIPIDPGASMATLSGIFGGDAAMKRAIEGRRGVYPSAFKALTGQGGR